jgi:hypothetical protein
VGLMANYALSESGLSKPELRMLILDVLGSGEKMTAHQIVKAMSARGKTSTTGRVSAYASNMGEVDREWLVDRYGSQICYRYWRR